MRAKAIVVTNPASAYPVTPDTWTELRIGERGTVSGKLASVGYGAPGTLMIEFPNWDSLVVDCDMPRDTKPIALSSQVHVRVERTEDGLKAIAIWTEGSVPIPLIDRR